MERTGNRLVAAFMSLMLAAGLLPLIPSASFAGEASFGEDAKNIEQTADANGTGAGEAAANANEAAANTSANTNVNAGVQAEGRTSANAQAGSSQTDTATAQASGLQAGASAQAAAREDLAISIVGSLRDGDTELTLDISGDLTGTYVMVRTFDASATVFRPSYIPYEDDTVIFNKTKLSAGQTVVSLKAALQKDQQVVAFIYDYDEDVNVRKLAASAPVSVGEAGSGQPTEPTDPAKATRADLLNGSYITLTTPNETGAAAGKFLDTDRSAKASVVLHSAVPSATFSVVAWPRTLSFGSDIVDADDINRFGKRLFTKYNVKNGDAFDVTFDDAVFSSLEDPTAYVIIAYLQFADTTNDDAWPIVKPTARFDIVNSIGEGFEDYVFPDATIDEAELPVGATTMHISLSGDERLFQIARDSRNENANLQIHVSVVEYDASVTPETYDYEETDQVRLYTMDAYEAFKGKEITLSEPLQEGKRVRALVYTTQYSGSLAPNPIPASHDYTASKPDDSVLVTKTAPPIVMNPAVAVAGSLSTDTTSFDVTVAYPPENSMVLVKCYAPNETIATQNGTFLASMSATEGTHKVTLSAQSPLGAGYRVVAFIMCAGEVRAQSAPAVVSGEAAEGDVVILGPVDKDDTTVRVMVNCDVPAGAHISLRQFDEPVNTKWGSQNSVGSVENPVRGENVVSVSGLKRNYVVAFLATDYGNTIYAASEPMAVTHTPVQPSAKIKPADVMFTEGDLYLNLTWLADKYAKNVSYRIYQYEGDVFDEAAAEVIATGNIANSISHSGTQGVSLSGTLLAGHKVCAMVIADGLSAVSEPLLVGAKPAWAEVVPSVSFVQDAVHVSDRSIKVLSSYDAGYEELGSEYFCVVSVYELTPDVVAAGFTDEDLEGVPVVAHYRNDTRNDPTRGELDMVLKDGVQLTEGNYLAIKLRLPDPIRQDSQAMWRDYVSAAVPIVADEVDPGQGGEVDPGQGGTGGEGGDVDPGQGGDPNAGVTPGSSSGDAGNGSSANASKDGGASKDAQLPQTGDTALASICALSALICALAAVAAVAYRRSRVVAKGKHIARF